MSSLQLSLLEDHPWHVNQILLNQLSDYLRQDDSSVSAAALIQRLDDLFPTHRSPQDQPEDEPIEDTRTFFWNIWVPFHIAARQLPHDSAAQERLVGCLREISNTTSKTPVVKVASDGGFPEVECQVWQDMHDFGGKFWEMARFMECEVGIEGQWRNVMAYAARVTRDGIEDFSSFGKKSLDEALGYAIVERDRRGRPNFDTLTTEFTPGLELDQKVAVAADWIRYAGGALYEKFNENTDVHGWQFWRQRFEELCEDERVSQQTRVLAKATKEKMEGVEDKETAGRSSIEARDYHRHGFSE